MRNKYYYLLLFAVGLIFYILNVQTPFSHDDYAYCFYYAEDSYTVRPTDAWVTSVPQMFESMWHHYLCVNGRFVSHTLLQCFCAFLGKGVFNICNTIVYLLFLQVIVLLSEKKHSIIVLLLTFLCSLCLLPFPGQTILWMTGSLNYLWTTTATLWYVYWLRNCRNYEASILRHIVVFMICLSIGWMQESVTVPVAFGLFLYYIFNRKSFRGIIITSFMAYALGAALIVLGPGTFARMSSGGEISTQMDSIQFVFSHTYNTLYEYGLNILPMLALIVILLLFVMRYKRSKQVLMHSLYGMLYVAFLLFLLALGMAEERIYFGVSVLSWLIILRFVESFPIMLKQRWIAIVILFVICVFPINASLRATKAYCDFDENQYEEVRQAPSRCVLKDRHYQDDSRYVYVTNLSPDRYNFHNRVKAFYYGKEYIQALPDDLYDVVINETLDSLMVKTNRKVDGRELYEYGDHWLLPIEKIPTNRMSAIYIHDIDNETLETKQKVIRYLMNTLDSSKEIMNIYVVSINHANYLIFPKDVQCKDIVIGQEK